MFKLGNYNYLYLLALVAFMALILIRSWRTRSKALSSSVDPRLLSVVSPGHRGWRLRLEGLLILLSAAAMVLAAAWPLIGTGTRLAKSTGVDIVVAIDVSRSMQAKDVTPSRLDRAKLEIQDFLKKLNGDRVGVVVFAGEAFVQCPLTTDYEAARIFLRSVDRNSVPQPGTSVKKAISSARGMLRHVPEGAKTRVLVLLTDGEDHEGEAVEEAKAAAEEGVIIFAIGIGSSSGEPVPEFDEGGTQTGYKKDKGGQTVLSKLNEALLKQLASVSGGAYIHARNDEFGMEAVRAAVDRLVKTETQSRVIVEYKERFRWLLIPAFAMLLGATLLPLTSGIGRRRKKDFPGGGL
jgi:Ca-activated chloride channel family protein